MTARSGHGAWHVIGASREHACMVRGQCDMSPDEEQRVFRAGLALFNEGKFFEAHEIWEDAWNGTSGNRSTFYRGLIQMAVSLEHYRRGNALGCRKVFARAQQLWASFPDIYLGIDLRDFVASMTRAVQPALVLEPGGLLAPDFSGLFQIELLCDPFANSSNEV